MSVYAMLEWDSAIFGCQVAKIVPSCLSTDELATTLRVLHRAEVKLVYWASDPADAATQAAARAQGGLLADRKLTYLRALDSAPHALSGLNDIEAYTAPMPSAALTHLALESGSYSRFKTDSRVAPAIFERIYCEWITNSVNKQLAQAIFCVQRVGELAGMLTLGTKNGRGDIGLLAVHADYRGLQIGTDLVYAAQHWFAAQGFAQCQVVTQEANRPACALYEKCGFTIEKVENFYHFWL